MAELYDQSRNDALRRLNQTLLQIDPYDLPPYPNLSIVTGPLDPPLVQLTLSQLLQQQASCYPNEEAVVIPWTNARWTYQKLWEESSLLARALLKEGVRPRDRIGIMSGNCEKYIALFFACARVGAICVTLNNTYTATEMEYALKHTSTYPTQNQPQAAIRKLTRAECRILFTTPTIARLDNTPLLERLSQKDIVSALPDLKRICLIRGQHGSFIPYSSFIDNAQYIPEHILDIFDGIISPHDVANLQFTSGSTGKPKAAMLTHQ